MTTRTTANDTTPDAGPGGRWPHALARRRGRRRLAWVLAGGGAVAVLSLVLALGPNTDARPERFDAAPPQEPDRRVPTDLEPEARRVAVRFIQTAVARKNLEEAWTLVGPNLRGGLSRAAWLTGENPVVPYPIDLLEVAPFKVDESFTTSALLEVALIPRAGSGVRAQVFFLGLRRLGDGPGRRWVVDNWVPRASAVVPR